jgi:hypothetical protein
MHRRFFFLTVPALALMTLALALLSGQHTAAHAQPGYTVSAAQLQQMAAQRFPVRYPVAGLLNLDVQAPLLRLLPEHNRLSAQMAVDAAGPALVVKQKGSFEVDFALRYEASDRSIRAHKLRFRQLRVAGLEPAASELLNVYGPSMAEQSLQEVVLHQLRPQDLAVADGLGMQPGSITVTDSGLVIGFEAKPLK